jgi:Tol biopolymer transport system component
VWDVANLDPTCATTGEEVQANPASLAWSPDSSAVAFSFDTAVLFVDSDIFVFERATGQITNLTDDHFDGALPLDREPGQDESPVDLAPTWAADGASIYFGRMSLPGEDTQPTIMKVARSGGEPEVVATLEAGSPWGVNYSMVALPDGTLVYAVSTGIPDNPAEGIWVLEPGTEPVQLLSGTVEDDFPFPRVVDAAETAEGILISGYSDPLSVERDADRPATFLIHLESGEITPGELQASPVVFSPDGDASIHAELVGNRAVYIVTTADTRSDLGELARSRYEFSRGVDWAANNTLLLVQGISDATIVTIAARQA